ncbi:MAG: hypothetical protein RBS96_02035 [Dehalococcoidales bacterium]|jgi:hypothetical protein|nr:hypothetical protein [Dehalococcoidales bacterium]
MKSDIKFADPIFQGLLDIMVKKHKITVRYDKVNGLGPNQCWVSGRDIWVSEQQDSEDDLMIGVMHGIGHIICPRSFRFRTGHDTYMMEYNCWVLGINEALKHGVTFSDAVINDALTRHLGSYRGHDCRESSGHVFTGKVPEHWRRDYFLSELKRKTPSWIQAFGWVMKEVMRQMWAVIKNLSWRI